MQVAMAGPTISVCRDFMEGHYIRAQLMGAACEMQADQSPPITTMLNAILQKGV